MYVWDNNFQIYIYIYIYIFKSDQLTTLKIKNSNNLFIAIWSLVNSNPMYMCSFYFKFIQYEEEKFKS